jgi:tetratricopeptide (TPR) repeat protein
LVGILFILIPCTHLYSQTQEEKIQEDITQRQAAYEVAMDRLIESGVESMEAGNYAEADDIFRQVLKESRVVPTIMTFYFGKNSFYLEKYTQSIDWLNKYIQLKGTTGRYYEEAADLLNKSNEAVRLLRQQEAVEVESILAASYEIDCGPTGKVICPVCKGRTVIITTTSFGEKRYKECPYSDEHGYLSCPEYNLLLRGALEKKR